MKDGHTRRPPVSVLFLLVIGLVNLVRGGAHLLLPDSGAAAAGMSLDHSSAALALAGARLTPSNKL